MCCVLHIEACVGSPLFGGGQLCLEEARMCVLYCTLRPVIQNLRSGLSSSLAPTTCRSFCVSSSERPPPALVNLNSTFTLLETNVMLRIIKLHSPSPPPPFPHPVVVNFSSMPHTQFTFSHAWIPSFQLASRNTVVANGWPQLYSAFSSLVPCADDAPPLNQPPST